MLNPEDFDHPTFCPAEVRRQLERILAFPELQASDRRREMLRYVVEEALEGRTAEIKATTIAMAVFGRGADFDQQTDPVVRLEARKLRRDLDNYYADAGREDAIRISIPKGRYVPVFDALESHDAVPASPEPSRDSDVPEGAVDGASHAPEHSGRRVSVGLLLSGMVLSGLVSLALVWALMGGRQEPSYVDAPFEGSSILVRAFDTRNADSVTTLVADLLAQDITGALLKFPDIRAYTDMAHTDAEADAVPAKPFPRQIAYAVHGSVWRDQDQVFVRADLSRSGDGEMLWTELFAASDRAHGIAGVSEEISAQIASVIGQQYGIVRSETRKTLLSETANPSLQSYACISLATEYRRTIRAENYWDARACLEETVRREPEFARGWAMLAYLRNDGSRFGYDTTLTQEEAFAQAREAAARALTLSPRDTDALKAMSHILHYAGDAEQSIEYARRAVEMNPNDPETVGNLGVMLGFQGQLAEAKPHLEFAIARSIAPAPRYYQFLAMAHMMNEDWEDMESAASYAVADDSGFSYFLSAVAHAMLANASAARMDYQRLLERTPALAEDPKTALKVHKVDPAVLDAFAAGLDRVHAVIAQ
ncbi:hypothetical protein [Maritimibacter alkaliphilus]|uniref:hypothetical protein n=1 Tax=Maritimibacter alkaliphilus TaxID=404236 RepID=UPI001C96769D|nr:hypothetical protein [Maritimibacter alkaliphilus]MBY6092842.1 hypothetical protein [Maritimibacter alkaliphilus]